MTPLGERPCVCPAVKEGAMLHVESIQPPQPLQPFARRSARPVSPVSAPARRFEPAAAWQPLAERLAHPLERWMDSPRAQRTLGIFLPLIAQVMWRGVALACDDAVP